VTGLPAAEGIIDASSVAPRIEALLPSGARRRQLSVRTLLLGMMLALADGRPAHLTRVRQALLALPEGDQARLGVTEDGKKHTGHHGGVLPDEFQVQALEFLRVGLVRRHP
jgi:hypothetical protein